MAAWHPGALQVPPPWKFVRTLNMLRSSSVLQYLEPETEAAADTAPEVLSKMPKDWPAQGAIEVSNLIMRWAVE